MFSLCLLSILKHRSLRHPHCLGNVRYCSPRCFHPNDQWLAIAGWWYFSPWRKSNWPVTKSWLLGWPKLCWFQLYCSKTIWSFSLIFARYVTRYIHIILTMFQEATQCLTLWKISLEIFCKTFFRECIIFNIGPEWHLFYLYNIREFRLIN